MSDRRVALIEPLEDRRLLSTTPVYGQLTLGWNRWQDLQDAKAAEYQQQVARAVAAGKAAGITPSILGTWKGRVRVGMVFTSKHFDLTVQITDVTPKTATGTVTVDGHKYSGTFKGQTKATEEFTYAYTKGKETVTIAGLLNGLNTAATGTVTAKYHGWNVKGTFSFSKVKVA